MANRRAGSVEAVRPCFRHPAGTAPCDSGRSESRRCDRPGSARPRHPDVAVPIVSVKSLPRRLRSSVGCGLLALRRASSPGVSTALVARGNWTYPETAVSGPVEYGLENDGPQWPRCDGGKWLRLASDPAQVDPRPEACEWCREPFEPKSSLGPDSARILAACVPAATASGREADAARAGGVRRVARLGLAGSPRSSAASPSRRPR